MKTALDLVAAAKPHVHEIDIDAADAAIRDADVLIDVREADEFAVLACGHEQVRGDGRLEALGPAAPRRLAEQAGAEEVLKDGVPLAGVELVQLVTRPALVGGRLLAGDQHAPSVAARRRIGP